MSDNEDIEEISNEEKLKIAQHYLLSSPPSQFQEVLNDIKKLIPDGLIDDTLATSIARIYNYKTSKILVSPLGNKVALAQIGEVDPDHFVDPISNSVFRVNHLTGEVNESTDIPFPLIEESLGVKRTILQTAVSKYVKSQFASELAAGSVFVKDSSLVIVISGEKPNLRNFWSGRWASIWTVDPSIGSINGEIKIHAHYFEDGNVQLLTNKPALTGKVATSTDTDLASSVIAFIKASESQLQNGLEEMYSNMNDETFRAMRRTMPISRTKMEWNVNAVRMVKQVRK